jgi:acetolactate synthase regulatory subunit
VTFADILAAVITALDGAGVPYMITGSLASSYHGEPRATRDVDIVIDPGPGTLERLVDAVLQAGFYVDRDVARTALGERTQFNAIGSHASKIDFIIRKDRPFSVEEFGRREPADLLGTAGFVTTAEDLILAKLEWANATGSERQLRDVAGIVAIGHSLDEAYIERWAAALGTADAWHRARDAAR